MKFNGSKRSPVSLTNKENENTTKNALSPKLPLNLTKRANKQNWDEKPSDAKEKKHEAENENKSKLKHISLNSHVLNKNKKNLNQKTKCQKTSDFLVKLFENIYINILFLLCSVFTLLQEDLKILALPLTVDKPFYRVNEVIFFFFLMEFLVISLCKKNFRGSFFFYLDLISIISMVPDVRFIWDPIVNMMDDSSSTIKEILGNSYFAKGSKASQAGAK